MKKIGYNISTYNRTHTTISQMLLSPNLKSFHRLVLIMGRASLILFFKGAKGKDV
jgi:hypothetical protein